MDGSPFGVGMAVAYVGSRYSELYSKLGVVQQIAGPTAAPDERGKLQIAWDTDSPAYDHLWFAPYTVREVALSVMPDILDTRKIVGVNKADTANSELLSQLRYITGQGRKLTIIDEAGATLLFLQHDDDSDEDRWENTNIVAVVNDCYIDLIEDAEHG